MSCSGVWLACSAPPAGSTAAAGGTGATPSNGGNSSQIITTAGALNAGGAGGASPSGGTNPNGRAQAPGGSATGGITSGNGNGGSEASGGVTGGGNAGQASGGSANTAFDVTFYVVADTHADPVPEDDLLAEARAVNAVAADGNWPAQIDGQTTGFKGGAIGKPRGVVFVGDLTGWGTAPTEIPMFQHYFEAGNSADSIAFPAFLGLGNHDIDSADRGADQANQYRALEWAYIDSRHQGNGAPVPVTSYDAASHAYSFDFDRVHLVQVHRFAGDTQYGLASGMGFLQQDLAAHAKDGRPVVLFHHYGMDTFGTEDRWWTQAQRDAYRAALDGYNVVAVMVGHSHAAFNYSWQGLRVFQTNNAKAEIGTGNNDGNGSFSIVRITNAQIDVVTCRWLDATGKYELVQPFYSDKL